MKTKIQLLYLLFIFIIVTTGCSNKNHLDEHKITIDSLNSLPDNFYAYRNDKVYISDQANNYMIWFDLDLFGNIKKISEIKDIKAHNKNLTEIINDYKIDTVESKSIAQNFIDLSGEFKFGHLNIDRKNKISFSTIEDLREEFVWAFNDSIKNKYYKNQNFRLLQNGWFEYCDQ